MPAYTAVLTVNMVFEWHRSVEEMKFIFAFWTPSDFARAMDDGGPIASLWRVDEIQELPPERVDEAWQLINQVASRKTGSSSLRMTKPNSRSEALAATVRSIALGSGLNWSRHL
jgi:hypothetical protein